MEVVLLFVMYTAHTMKQNVQIISKLCYIYKYA